MRTEARACAVLLLGLAGLLAAAGARAGEFTAPLPTNSDLLSRALRAAADSAFRTLPLEMRQSVVMVPAAGQASDWAVENQLATVLRGRVGKLAFRSAPTGSANDTAGAPTLAQDSLSLLHRAIPQKTAPLKNELQLLANDPTAHALEYRIASLTLAYEGLHRSRMLGPGQVERVAVAEIGVRLLDPHGQLLGSGSGSAQVRDEIPQLRLPEVEDRMYQINRPSLPTRNLTRVLEPAIVIGLVSGLIFLFYTNRN